MRKVGPGRYEKICIGTTTSARMVRFTEGLGAQYGVRTICGKGGFPDEAIEPMERLGMVYFAIVGGAAALETTQIEEIEEVAWEELMPECLWKFRVKDFGPLIVGIDAADRSTARCRSARRRSWRSSMPDFNDGFLGVPSRPGKPRDVGVTHVMDKGLNLRDIEGLFDTAGQFVDIVKFGWGTSYVTNNLEKKIALYRSFATPVVCGGTLFEAVYGRGRIDEFQTWTRRAPLLARRDLGRHRRDPSRAEARADHRLRPGLHRALGGRLQGLGRRLRPTSGSRWINEELAAGAWKVITEGREGGTAGIFRADGDMRTGLLDEIAHGVPIENVLFEPPKSSQAWFVKHFRARTSTSATSPDEVIPLETLRLGLRGDALKCSWPRRPCPDDPAPLA